LPKITQDKARRILAFAGTLTTLNICSSSKLLAAAANMSPQLLELFFIHDPCFGKNTDLIYR